MSEEWDAVDAPCDTIQHSTVLYHGKLEIVMMPTLSSLVAQEVFVLPCCFLFGMIV